LEDPSLGVTPPPRRQLQNTIVLSSSKHSRLTRLFLPLLNLFAPPPFLGASITTRVLWLCLSFPFHLAYPPPPSSTLMTLPSFLDFLPECSFIPPSFSFNFRIFHWSSLFLYRVSPLLSARCSPYPPTLLSPPSLPPGSSSPPFFFDIFQGKISGSLHLYPVIFSSPAAARSAAAPKQNSFYSSSLPFSFSRRRL